MRAWTVSLLLAFVALAGCTSDEPTTDDHDGHDEPDGMDGMDHDDGVGGNETVDDTPVPDDCPEVDDSNGTRTGEDGCPVANSVPEALLGSDILTAQAPAAITFSFEGADADNDTLQWGLDVDSDGVFELEGNETQLPGSYTHTFETDGEYLATFSLSDGNVTAIETAVVTITPASFPFIFEAYFAEPCLLCGEDPTASISHLTGQAGIDQVWVEIPAEYIGTEYAASALPNTLGLAFFDACDGSVVEVGGSEGTVPEGAGCVAMWHGGTVRGGKLSFVADGDLNDLPEDLTCYADGVQIGVSELGAALYQTDGTWVYQEGNGIPGIQWNGEPSGPLEETHKPGCANGDIVII